MWLLYKMECVGLYIMFMILSIIVARANYLYGRSAFEASIYEKKTCELYE